MLDRIGNYKITDEIGYGGMAVVYKGTQESLERTVAIKALRSSVSGEQDAVARFKREATSMASFQHENIITVYDFIPHRGALFIVMEYVEGIDLYDLLERCHRLPADIAAIVSLQVARALDYAHFRAVIHRDVKPANIILSKLGTVKLTDFGIARLDESDLTWTGVGLGTPTYMSPEQVVGQRLDPRCDIFSLGVVMYQMVTGRKPFDEDEQETTLHKVRYHEPPPPRSLNPALPRDLEAIISRCMQKAPADRFASTQELMLALERYLADNVNLNYRAKLLLFLQEQGVVSQQEAKSTLHPALSDGGATPGPRLRRLRTGAWLAGLATLILLGCMVLLAALLSGRSCPQCPTPPGEVSQTGASASGVATSAPARAAPGAAARGRLRVVVSPWARVLVDGQLRAVTPLDRPLDLSPGEHLIRLENPRFSPVERRIVLVAGRPQTLRVDLDSSPPRGPAGSEEVEGGRRVGAADGGAR